MNQYLITRMRGSVFSFLMKGEKAVEIHCDPEDEKHILGNIYIGRIKNIAGNIGAAFVEIAPGLTCYLSLDSLRNPVYTRKGASEKPQAGDELLVQVQRERIKTKYPSVTTNLSLQGKYLVLTTGNISLSVSSKLSREKKEELFSFARENMDKERKYGWIFRTNCGSAGRADILSEMQILVRQYEALMAKAPYSPCFSCLQKTPAAYLKRLTGLYDSEAEDIVTDDAVLYQELEHYLTLHCPGDLRKLRLYSDKLQPMAKLYSLETHLSRALQERVWLDCGGYLIIQPTEALTVIDVNSGRYEGGRQRETAFLKLNLEAAAEIARQLRLRSISGIIVVDFINMEEEASERKLLDFLREELRRDPVPTALVDMTKLSLVEITRMKREKSLAESVLPATGHDMQRGEQKCE